MILEIRNGEMSRLGEISKVRNLFGKVEEKRLLSEDEKYLSQKTYCPSIKNAYPQRKRKKLATSSLSIVCHTLFNGAEPAHCFSFCPADF